MSLQKLKEEIESNEVVKNRNVEIKMENKTLHIIERGNPALEYSEEKQPIIEETDYVDLTQLVQDIANDVLGRRNYRCNTYADVEISKTSITE